MTPERRAFLDDARRIAESGDLQEVLFLVRHGVDLDVADALEPIERLAWVVIFGQFEGGEFDWQSGEWRRRDP